MIDLKNGCVSSLLIVCDFCGIILTRSPDPNSPPVVNSSSGGRRYKGIFFKENINIAPYNIFKPKEKKYHELPIGDLFGKVVSFNLRFY